MDRPSDIEEIRALCVERHPHSPEESTEWLAIHRLLAENDEPMISKSMHLAAVEAAQTFARQDVEREALKLIARLVEAAGGEIKLSRRAMADDAPDLLRSEEFLENADVYRTKRRAAADRMGRASG